MEAPHLQRFHGRYSGKGLRVIGVAPMDAGLAAIRAFVKRHGVTYPTLVDPNRTAVRLYGIKRYPGTVLVDRGGRVRSLQTGFRSGDEERLERALLAALTERSPARQRRARGVGGKHRPAADALRRNEQRREARRPFLLPLFVGQNGNVKDTTRATTSSIGQRDEEPDG